MNVQHRDSHWSNVEPRWRFRLLGGLGFFLQRKQWACNVGRPLPSIQLWLLAPQCDYPNRYDLHNLRPRWRDARSSGNHRPPRCWASTIERHFDSPRIPPSSQERWLPFSWRKNAPRGKCAIAGIPCTLWKWITVMLRKPYSAVAFLILLWYDCCDFPCRNECRRRL